MKRFYCYRSDRDDPEEMMILADTFQEAARDYLAYIGEPPSKQDGILINVRTTVKGTAGDEIIERVYRIDVEMIPVARVSEVEIE